MIQKKRTSTHGGMDTSAVIVSRVSAPSNISGAIGAICVSLIFLLSACGNSSSDKTGAQNTGSLSFSIKWVTKAKPGGATAGPNEAASVNCAALGVDKVWAALSGGPNTTVVALGGPWNCTDGQGTIPLSGIQTLNNVTLLIQGLNASGTVIYSGSQSGVFADGSKSQDGGTVTVSPVSGTMTALSSAALGQLFTNYSSTVPSAPSGVSAMGGSGQATVSWTAVTGATSYNVYYGTTTGVTIANGTKVTGATSGGAITDLTNGTTYYFVVTAVNAIGESAVSSEVSATPSATITVPSAPTGVSATAGNARVTLNWTAAAGATSYNVHYTTTPSGAWSNVTTDVTSGSAITGLTNGTTYYFYVASVNGAGEGVGSSVVSATPLATIAAPAYARGSLISKGSILITSGSGTSIPGLVVGNWYAVETNGGPWYYFSTTVGGAQYSTQSSVDSTTWYDINPGFTLCYDLGNNVISCPATPWISFTETVNTNYTVLYFKATTASIQMRVPDTNWIDNSGSMSWRLYNATGQ